MKAPKNAKKRLRQLKASHEPANPAVASVEPGTTDREGLGTSLEPQGSNHTDGQEFAKRNENPAPSEQKPLANLLLELQLLEVVPNVRIPSKDAQSVVQDDVKAIYHALAPRNMLESLLARVLVALNSASMEMFRNAVRYGGDPDAVELFVRRGCKASSTLTATVEAYGKLQRDDRNDVQINNVNVEAGAQAIVGKIEVGNGRKEPRAQSPITKRLANDIEEAA